MYALMQRIVEQVIEHHTHTPCPDLAREILRRAQCAHGCACIDRALRDDDDGLPFSASASLPRVVQLARFVDATHHIPSALRVTLAQWLRFQRHWMERKSSELDQLSQLLVAIAKK